MTKITISGVEFALVYEKVEDGTGEFLLDERTIRIDPDKPHQEAILLHEILHAAFAVSGWAEVLGNKREEALTRMLEHALGPFFKVPE